MLKRQRVSTPPPSASTPDEEAYPPPPMDEPRQSNKRQRILPPSLDGQARGWMNRPPGQSPTDSDEEYIDEDEIHDYSMLRLGDGGVDVGPPTAAYKEVNHFLHDLHAEQQHRTLFTLGSVSSEMPSNLASPAFYPDLPLEMNHHHKYALHHPPPPLLSTIQRKDGSGDGQSIGQEYEHSNRLLRNLFLARRRHLSDAPPG